MTDHGTRACYATGCRRIECIDANAEYQRAYRNTPSAVTRERQRRVAREQKKAQAARDDAALFSD